MTTLDNATLTDTTIDFGPLLALRDLAQAPEGGLDGLCARIVAGDPEALIAGQALLAREERLERDLKAKVATMYDRTSRFAAKERAARRRRPRVRVRRDPGDR